MSKMLFIFTGVESRIFKFNYDSSVLCLWFIKQLEIAEICRFVGGATMFQRCFSQMKDIMWLLAS